MLRGVDPNIILIIGTLAVLLLSLASTFIGRGGLASETGVEEPQPVAYVADRLPPIKGREDLSSYIEDVMNSLKNDVLAVSYDILADLERAKDNIYDTSVALYFELKTDPTQIGQLTRSYVLEKARRMAEDKFRKR